ncbi:hypothetical protein Clacol_003398 [Clathrus columnatus]|uniref:Uncharacterized protein n=1 Tax=Clathrus columnatus TaxID=1419009 RepID=A0AAV5A838_9AGAM|nr:hypothetical protein Clacol_003398 [Clathrus columnatus]
MFSYNPPFDLDDQAPTPRSSTPISPTIEDFEMEVRVYRSSSSKLSINPDTLWPQYPPTYVPRHIN